MSSTNIVAIEEFIPQLTSEHPELTRRYLKFDWSKLLNASRLRINKTPDKHIKLGLLPEGISIEEYQQIWSVYTNIKKLIAWNDNK